MILTQRQTRWVDLIELPKFLDEWLKIDREKRTQRKFFDRKIYKTAT